MPSMPSICFPPSRSFEQLELLQVQLSDQKQLEVFGAALAEHCLLLKNVKKYGQNGFHGLERDDEVDNKLTFV